MTVRHGCSAEFVASSLPPSPVSRMIYSTSIPANASIPMPNKNSKYDGCSIPSSSICLTTAITFANTARNVSSSTGTLFLLIRSLTVTRCGDVKKPTLLPSAIRTACRYAHTDPFPLVPATWMILRSNAGFPSLLKNSFVCSSVCFFVNLGISSI